MRTVLLEFAIILLCVTCRVLSKQCVTENEIPRVFILTDISNEPDDTQSLIRLLLHSNELQIEGLVATTSYWLNSSTYSDQIHTVIDAYARVVDNLQVHSHTEYPSPEYLSSIVRDGSSVYGMAAVGTETISKGAELLIEKAFSSEEPLWVQAWGGVNVLGEALEYIRATKSVEELAMFISHIRVYTISDQDDVGSWIRREFPSLFYICSVHGWNHYGNALWTGISGEKFYHFDGKGPNTEIVSNPWVQKHVQIGPLGSEYPDIMFIMEGDTPALLYNVVNGLNSPEHPEWGGWGGRYTLVDHTRRSLHFSDAIDTAIGQDGIAYTSQHASIWRWRQAFQAEIAARIQWSVRSEFESAPHPPVVIVNLSCSSNAIKMNVTPGVAIKFDASESYDPNSKTNEVLKFKWWTYREVTATQSQVEYEVPDLDITTDSRGLVATIQVPAVEVACAARNALHADTALQRVCQQYHIILEVSNSEELPLTRYRRIVLQVLNEDGRNAHDEL